MAVHYPTSPPRAFPCSVCRALHDGRTLRFVGRDDRAVIRATPIMLCPDCLASAPAHERCCAPPATCAVCAQ